VYYSPLLISLDDSSVQAAKQPVSFKLNPMDASSISYSWVKANLQQGFVAYDFNQNGLIDDGTELIGNFTKGRSFKDAYQALREIADKDDNGLITGPELQGLLLWQDRNEDGISQKDELTGLVKLGVTELNAGQSVVDVKTLLGDGIYSLPHSEVGVKLVVNGQTVTGKSYDIWLKRSQALAYKDHEMNGWKQFINSLNQWIQSVVNKQV